MFPIPITLFLSIEIQLKRTPNDVQQLETPRSLSENHGKKKKKKHRDEEDRKV